MKKLIIILAVILTSAITAFALNSKNEKSTDTVKIEKSSNSGKAPGATVSTGLATAD